MITHRYALAALLIVPFAIVLVTIVVSTLREDHLSEQRWHEKSWCRDNFHQLRIALESYQDEYGTLPPAVTVGPDGKPWHSWRVLLLPYLEELELYEQYNMNEPWDGPSNLAIAHSRTIGYLRCSRSNRPITTAYCMVTGKGTLFGEDGTTAPRSTWLLKWPALVVEIENSDIGWTEPRDIKLNDLLAPHGPRASKKHSGKTMVLNGDGSVEHLPESMTAGQFSTMFTK